MPDAVIVSALRTPIGTAMKGTLRAELANDLALSGRRQIRLWALALQHRPVTDVAHDAVIRVRGPKGDRQIPIADFHRLPGITPERDTNLASDELIVALDLPAMPFATRSHYLKVRDRASYAFALLSVAAALDLDSTKKIKAARVALGGVADKP